MAKKLKRAGPGPRPCIFCGPRKPGNRMSGEHLWSDWMRCLLPSSVGFVEERLIFPMPGDKHPETIQQERQGAPKDKKIPVVCEECNTGWMSRLETAVIPILTPIIKNSFCAITPDRRRLIAQWLTLKTIVLEHDRAIGLKTVYPIHEQSDLTKFMTGACIPPGFRAWIGSGAGSGWEMRLSRFEGGATLSMSPFLPPDFNPPTGRKNVQSVTWGIGRLRVFIVSTIDENIHKGFDWDFPNFIRLWPPGAPDMIWPPGTVVPDVQMFQLARRMKDLTGASAAARALYD